MNIFKEYLEKNSIDIDLIETEESTKTAQEAASTHGVPVSNIVKSLLVRVGDRYVLYLVPGDRRLDLDSIGGRMANANEVKDITGYSIGGVPPFGHKNRLETILVEGFNEEEPLYAAGGKPNIVFKISLNELKRIVL